MPTTTRKTIRQDVGETELGILLTGTATAVTTTSLTDTSDDSLFDAGDDASRLSGAGILIDDGTTLHYRTNLTYVPASQQVTWSGAISGLSGTPTYEIHTEPILHPLRQWPKLINQALQKIRTLDFQYILLANRRYYDLADWTDLDGAEKFRRLYYCGPNLVQNADYGTWATADALPQNWTLVSGGNPTRGVPANYPHSVVLDGNTIRQSIAVSGIKRLRGVVWCLPVAPSLLTVTLAAILADGTVERSSVQTSSGIGIEQLIFDLELTQNTTTVRLDLAESGANSTSVWSPMVYEVSRGIRQRIQPVNVLAEAQDEAYSLVLARNAKPGVAELVLLKPYTDLSEAATNAGDIDTTTAPPRLIKAAVAQEVLRWLVQRPAIPQASKAEYARSLVVWESLFSTRAREHMRKLSKSQQVWESGELNG